MMPTVESLLKDNVTLKVECIDRLYLNGYVPRRRAAGEPLVVPPRAPRLSGHLARTGQEAHRRLRSQDQPLRRGERGSGGALRQGRLQGGDRAEEARAVRGRGGRRDDRGRAGEDLLFSQLPEGQGSASATRPTTLLRLLQGPGAREPVLQAGTRASDGDHDQQRQGLPSRKAPRQPRSSPKHRPQRQSPSSQPRMCGAALRHCFPRPSSASCCRRWTRTTTELRPCAGANHASWPSSRRSVALPQRPRASPTGTSDAAWGCSTTQDPPGTPPVG